MRIAKTLILLSIILLVCTCKKKEDEEILYNVQFKVTNGKTPLAEVLVFVDNFSLGKTDVGGQCSTKLVNGVHSYEIFSNTNIVFSRIEKEFNVAGKDLLIEERMDSTRFTVKFDSDGGNAIEEQVITYGGKVKRPENPQKENYSFNNWYLGTYPYSFSSPVYKDITLVAKWLKIFTVVFMYDETTIIDAKMVIEGNKVAKLADNPTRVGYVFNGWYVDDKQYDFYSPVKSDLKIMAKWLKLYTVDFNTEGGSFVVSQQIAEGDTIRKSLIKTVKDGFSLEGWYVNGLKYDFKTPVITDLTLTAQWGYAVVFKFGGTDIVNYVIPPANSVVLPVNPTNGYSSFVRWFTQGTTTGTPDFTSSSIVTSDTTVYAEWSLRDIDNNIYKAVTIGKEVWMAENLRTTRYNNGTAITLVESTDTWKGLTSGAYCYYNNNANNEASTYGALYNWYAIRTTDLCPTGWDAPTALYITNSLENLRNELDQHFGFKYGEFLKSEVGWQSYSGVVNRNTTGFSALPGGIRDSNGSFSSKGQSGYWWLWNYNELSYGGSASYIGLFYQNYYFDHFVMSPKNGMSIRCVRYL